MISLCLAALLVAQDLRVHGLRAHETAAPLAPALVAEPPATDAPRVLARGRVIDAASGAPIAGATVETWTEEIDEHAPGFHRVGEATSGPDGGFLIRVRDGGLFAEKARASAPGYLAAPGVSSELDTLLLFPRPAWTPELRVLDLEGRPLPDAVVTSTYSCAHDVPAFEVRSDAQGLARLDAWGLQERTPELRVRAAVHAAWKYLDLHDVLPRVDAPPHELRLPRRAPFGARLVDAGGRPVPGAALHVVDGDGFHVVRTAADGRFQVEAPYGDGDVTIYRLGGGGSEHVFSGRLPRGRTVALSTAGRDAAADVQRARLVLELPPLAGDAPRLALRVFHASGWNDAPERREDGRLELVLPAGESLVALGGAFGGWEEELVELELAPREERVLSLAPRAEPRLTLLTPAGGGARLVVQAGDDSVELEDAGEGRVVLSVPRDAPLVALREGDDVRRALHPGLDGDAELDLRGADCVLVPAPPPDEPAPVAFEVRVLDARGAPLGGELEASGPGESVVTELSPGRYGVLAPEGAPLALCARVPGHADCWRVVRAEERDAPVELRPAPLASLSIESELELSVECAEALDALHPGPLQLLLTAADGRRVGLSLELAPGERRSLRVE